jgi:Fe2+ transport system protein FeoA
LFVQAAAQGHEEARNKLTEMGHYDGEVEEGKGDEE